MNAENYCCKMHEHVILNERVKKEIVMVTIRGLYNAAVCYTPELEELAAKAHVTPKYFSELFKKKSRSLPVVRSALCLTYMQVRAARLVPQ